MKETWVFNEAGKVKTDSDYVILENPAVRRKLDAMLLKTYWPQIQQYCEKTGYFLPVEKNKETESDLGIEYGRRLIFMLFDEQMPFFRGKLIVSLESWMLESEFFLGLPRETDPEIIFELLGNSRFVGNPPMLHIYKDHPHYFQITFHNGAGKSWFGTQPDELNEKIFHTIDVNISLHQLVEDNMINKDGIGEFISKAYQVYESY
jgi:hypothetical protein